MARIEKHGNLVTQIVKLPTTMRNHPYSPSLEVITWIKEGDIWQRCNWPNWTVDFVRSRRGARIASRRSQIRCDDRETPHDVTSLSPTLKKGLLISNGIYRIHFGSFCLESFGAFFLSCED